jgi:NADH-quinone oxidoreductase subunit H
MSVWHYFVNLLPNVRADWISWLQSFNLPSSVIVFLDSIVGITLILLFVFPVVMLFIWIERRFIARFQLRPGPNRCGPLGLLQPVADAVKILVKELIMPAKGDKLVHWIAPIIMFVAAFMVFAVFPIGSGVRGAFADLNIGILYVVAVSSLAVMAGWGSNNKYSLIGAVRGVAQLISYEVPMVLSIVGVVLIVGSLQMGEIVGRQTIPFILLQPLGFLIYFIGAITELNRSPMDMIEADSEIVAGYFTEYSGMKFAMFYLAEYINTLAIAIIVATLFLSGWKGPFLPFWFWFVLKVVAVFMFILWMRATLVRLRIDQVMALSWKFHLPVALVNVFITAAEVLAWDTWMSGWQSFPWPFIFLNFAIAAVLIVLWSRVFFKLGGGRVEVGGLRARNSQRYGADSQASVS